MSDCMSNICGMNGNYCASCEKDRRIKALEDDFDSMTEDRDYWKTQHDALEAQLEAVKGVMEEAQTFSLNLSLLQVIRKLKAAIREGNDE